MIRVHDSQTHGIRFRSRSPKSAIRHARSVPDGRKFASALTFRYLCNPDAVQNHCCPGKTDFQDWVPETGCHRGASGLFPVFQDRQLRLSSFENAATTIVQAGTAAKPASRLGLIRGGSVPEKPVPENATMPRNPGWRAGNKFEQLTEKSSGLSREPTRFNPNRSLDFG